MQEIDYIHLRVFSDYSLGKGAIKLDKLVEKCYQFGYPALAVTDSNNLSGSLEFANYAVKKGIQPIIGLDQSIEFEKDICGKTLFLALDENGYKNLLSISSASYLEQNNNAKVDLNKIKQNSRGLICITAGYESYEKKLFSQKRGQLIEEHLLLLQEIFSDNLYIEVNRWSSQTSADHQYEEMMLDLAYKLNIKIVATNHVSFLTAEMHEAHDILTCISQGRYAIEEDRPKLPGCFYLKSQAEMKQLFADLPEALENTIRIAKLCNFFPKNNKPLLPSYEIEEGDENTELFKQAKEGLQKRLEKITYDINHDEYFKRLEFELSVIKKMKYPGYFLIVSDFIKWSKANAIPVGPGRGSGAGSVVAWALEITDLDPLRFGLLFERFLNPDRVSMPDFDIDFCQEKREQVIKYVQDKYGKDQVSQIITFGKLQARAVLRDVGRVLHIPYGAIDKICKMVPNNPANPVTLAQAIALDKELQRSREHDPEIKKLLDISLKLEGLNRHSSTHAAGIIIADRPISEIVALYKDPASEMPAVQYSMKYAESAGLVKFDFLGLKTLTVIDWTVQYIKKQIKDFDINKIPENDEKSYKLLSSGKTIGIFQFESAGMKEAIKKLKPDTIEDLIALGSLYRPGPMDNIPSYINRKHGKEESTYLHEKMRPILEETFGIIVYQEQVMEIARQVAGYTLGQADLLRRAMGKKIKSEMEAQRNIFYEGCVKNGIDKKMAEEIFNLIEKFASYGFNKSHAAAYAVISYQTAYLKTNFTKEFLTASINLEINDTDKINSFIEDAKRFDIEILPPCINKSQAYFSLENEGIRFGLAGLKNVGRKISEIIYQEMVENGEYKCIFDFVERISSKGINKRLLESLAKSGALDCVEKNRNLILNNIDVLIKHAGGYAKNGDTKQFGLLFSDESMDNHHRPELRPYDEFNVQEKLNNEFEAFGFYLSSHPLESYNHYLNNLRLTYAKDIEGISTNKSKKVRIAGVIVSRKIRSSNRGRYAFLQVSDLYGLIEVSIFDEKLLLEHKEITDPGNLVYLEVDLKKDEKGLRVIVENIQLLTERLSNVKLNYSVVINSYESLMKLKSITVDNDQGIQVIPVIRPTENATIHLKLKEKIMVDKEKFESLASKGEIIAKVI